MYLETFSISRHCQCSPLTFSLYPSPPQCALPAPLHPYPGTSPGQARQKGCWNLCWELGNHPVVGKQAYSLSHCPEYVPKEAWLPSGTQRSSGICVWEIIFVMQDSHLYLFTDDGSSHLRMMHREPSTGFVDCKHRKEELCNPLTFHLLYLHRNILVPHICPPNAFKTQARAGLYVFPFVFVTHLGRAASVWQGWQQSWKQKACWLCTEAVTHL